MRKILIWIMTAILSGILCFGSIAGAQGQAVIIDVDDETHTSCTGSSSSSATLKGPYGVGTKYSFNSFTWSPQITGEYEVWLYNYTYSNNTSSACVTIEYADGVEYKQLDQKNGVHGWNKLGEYELSEQSSITLGQDVGTDGLLRASAVKFIPVGPEYYADGTDKKNETVVITPADSDRLDYEGFSASSIKTASGNTTFYGSGYCDYYSLLQGGKYKVSYYSCGNSSDTAAAVFDITSVEGITSRTIDSTKAGWTELGEYIFEGGTAFRVKLKKSEDGKQMRISDLKFERICTDTLSTAAVKVCDFDGKELSETVSADCQTLNLEGYVINDKAVKKTVSAIAARYNSAGKLTGVTTERIELLPYSIKKLGITFEKSILELDNISGTVKLYLWDNEELTPLALSRRLTVTQPVRRELFVSPNALPGGDGSVEKPYSSIQLAIDALSDDAYKAEGDVQILLRGGTYRLSQAIELTDENFDIGSNNLTIKPYNGERAVISGGSTVDAWEKYNGNIYRTYIGENVDFRQLYKAGEKQIQARKPNIGVYSVENTGEFIRQGIPMTKGYLDEVMDFTNQNVLWQWITSWTNRRYRVVSIDKQTSGDCDYVMFDEETDRAYGESEILMSATNGYFEGAYEFIDVPGEWAIRSGWLYYMAADGENPNDYEFICPSLEDNLIRISGNVYDRIENITISGIEFSYTNWTYPNKSGMHDIQANTIYPTSDLYVADNQYRKNYKKLRIPAAVHAEYTKDITIKDCTFNNIGGTGMAFLIGNDGVVIEGNELYDIAASGIEIGDDYYKARDFRMYPKSICIQNNYIHDIAQDYRGGCGITVMYADGVEILHNYIKEVPYSGMSVGWGWDNQPPEQHRNFTVSYNIIENAMQELYDGGLFYSPDPVNGNNIIEGNFLIGNERTMSPGSQQNGVYFDASSSGWHAKDNVIMNVPQNYAVSKDANTTIENLYTNNSSAALWEGGGEDILVVTGLVSDKKADWSTDYEARAFEIMKNAGLEEEYLYLAQRDKFKMYAPTPTYYIEDSGAENPLTVSVIIENKTNSQYSATISMEMNTETSISKQVVLAPGDNRVDFEVTIQAGQGLKIYPGRVKLTAENTLMSIPVYISIDPPEEFTVTIYDEGYEEVRGNWSVSGLPNTRIGSANSKGYAIARYTPSKLTSGTYKVWFYGVPNSANGLNPHDFIIYDRYGQKHVTKIYQRTIPAGWNHIGTYELDGKSYVELHQVGGGSMRTSPVAFCPLN